MKLLFPLHNIRLYVPVCRLGAGVPTDIFNNTQISILISLRTLIQLIHNHEKVHSNYSHPLLLVTGVEGHLANFESNH